MFWLASKMMHVAMNAVLMAVKYDAIASKVHKIRYREAHVEKKF